MLAESVSSQIEDLFSRRIDNLRAPGSVVAVFDTSGIIFSRGFGVACVVDADHRREASRPGAPQDPADGPTPRPGASDGTPTIDTAFRIASCTKSFTAAAVLLLRDRGLLHLDDPIDRYLDVGPLLLHGRARSAPTIRMLLSMSGGFPTDDPWADRLESQSAADFDAMTRAGYRLISIPGTAYEYSNLGFALLGRLIEKTTIDRYPRVVERELLRPLGLDAIGYDEQVAAPDGIATGYARRDDEWLPMPVSGPGAFSPIGGVFATARSLSAWAGWLAAAFDDGAVLENRRASGTLPSDAVLSLASRREMQQAARTIPLGSDDTARGRGYGYGLVSEVDAEGRVIVSHSGGYPGFSAHMRWNPATGIGVIGFENARYAGVSVPVTTTLTAVLDASESAPALDLWPETRAARFAVEHLLLAWDDAFAAALFAPNVEADEPMPHRRAALEADARAVGITAASSRPLEQCDPDVMSPAHLAWTFRGEHGALRCEVGLTPERSPRVQSLWVDRLS